MDEPSSDLIKAAADGDRDAFTELVRAYQAIVWRFLSRLLDDRALAEDITQETFVRVFLKLPTYSYGSKFSTWVLAVARNAGIDALRKQGRARRLEKSMMDVSRTTSPSPTAQVAVEIAIAKLPLKLREAFVLVEVVGMHYEEAAVALRVPVGTVKSRLHNARQALIGELEDVTDEM